MNLLKIIKKIFMAEKNKIVRYEFFNFQSTGGVFSQTLNIDKPASVKFIYTGQGGINDFAFINNNYVLQTLNLFTSGNSQYPYELDLSNNINEFDKTIYTIRLSGPGFNNNLKVIVKYVTFE